MSFCCIAPKTLNYLAFQSFDFECTWWRLLRNASCTSKFLILSNRTCMTHFWNILHRVRSKFFNSFEIYYHQHTDNVLYMYLHLCSKDMTESSFTDDSVYHWMQASTIVEYKYYNESSIYSKILLPYNPLHTYSTLK